MAGHISPDSYVSSSWGYEQRAYNEGYVATPTSYAYRYKPRSTWTEYLELYWADGKPRLCNAVKVWARSEYTTSDWLEVWIYANGGWVRIINTSIFQSQWKVGTFDTVLVERIRIRLKCGGGGSTESRWLRVYEAVLYEVDPIAPGYDNCIGLWRMNDNTTNSVVEDKSGGNRDGEFNDAGGNPNTDQHSVSGKIKTALNFDGVDDYISVADDPVWDVGGKLSIVLWFKTLTVLYDKHFIRHDVSAVKYEIFTGPFSMDNIEFGIQLPSGYSAATMGWGTDTLADGVWHLLIATFDRSLASKRLKLYLDGKCESTGVGFDEDIVDGDEGIVIGRASAGEEITGDIDNVMIFNKALSDSEVAFLWNEGNGREHLGVPRPLVDGLLASGRKGLV